VSKEVNDFEIYLNKKCIETTKNIIAESKVLSMPTAKVVAIVGDKYSVQMIGDTNIITGLNSYSNIPVSINDEVLLMVIGGSLTNTFIFSKKLNVTAIEELTGFFINSKAIVTNSSDVFYANYPNPPVGGVFNNLDANTGNIVNGGNIDTPATCWALINLLKVHSETNNSSSLNKAKLIGDYLVSHMINASFYGTIFRIMPNVYTYSSGWNPNTNTIHVRTQYHTLWALLELFKVTGDIKYSNACTELLKTVGNIYNNIKQRATTGGEISVFMVGATYNLIIGNGASVPNITFSWNIFNQNTADMLSRALPLYISLLGNTSIQDWGGISFIPQMMIDDFKTHLQYIYTNRGLTMTPTGLPYGFMQYENTDTVDAEGRHIPICKNFDWINGIYGNVWFVNDLTAWILIGLANLGLTTIANEYRNKYLLLKIAEYGDKLLFRDRYNFDGTKLIDDVSISICATALLYSLDIKLGIVDNTLHNLMQYTLGLYEKQSTNRNIDGSYSWDSLDVTSFIEVKATGEILYSPYVSN
jgi:hypothetical protein